MHVYFDIASSDQFSICMCVMQFMVNVCVANLEELQKEYESLKIERDELTTSLSQATLKITQGTLHIGVINF